MNRGQIVCFTVGRTRIVGQIEHIEPDEIIVRDSMGEDWLVPKEKVEVFES